MFIYEILTLMLIFLFQFRLVAKTSIKLLLVFVEYTESNTMHLVQAVNKVDSAKGMFDQ